MNDCTETFREPAKGILNRESIKEHFVCRGLHEKNTSSRDCRVVRSLDPSKGPGFETTFRPVTKCEETISLLSAIPGKKAKGITRCCHIERKEVALLD